MLRFKVPARSLLLVGLLSLGATARGDEVKVPLKDVPGAVLETVKAMFPGAELKEATKETEGEKTSYELGLKDKGVSIDVTLTPKGKIVEVERSVAPKGLPKAVASAIEAKYPKAAIDKAEEIVEFEGGKESRRNYEVVLTTEAKKKRELKLSPEGKILDDEAGE